MSQLLEDISQHLMQVSALHQQVVSDDLQGSVRSVQTWQTHRLLASHQAFWQKKRFKPAMQFFIDELYGPKDFSQRDEEIARVVPKMSKILPQKALKSLESALRLNSLSYQLDIALAQHLHEQPLNRDSYAKAYRSCDNQPSRVLQIELLQALGNDLAEVVKISGISTLLLLSRKPAKVAGVESLHHFLETGFKAFKKLGNVSEFIDPIVAKERQIMHDLFDPNKPNPLPAVASI